MRKELFVIKQFVESVDLDKLTAVSASMATVGGEAKDPPKNQADCSKSNNGHACINSVQCNQSTNDVTCVNTMLCNSANNGAYTCSSGGGGSHGTGDSPSMIGFPSMLM